MRRPGKTGLVTPRGRTLLFLAASFALCGRLAALAELTAAGVALGAIVGVAALSVWSRTGTIHAKRRLSPPRSPAGSAVRVDLEIRSEGSLGSGPLLVADHLPESIGESVRVALDPDDGSSRSRRVAYRLRPEVRGRYEIGPLEVLHTDPFGCVQRRQMTTGTSALVVYPAFEPIRTMPAGVERLGAVRRSSLIGVGDEFYALRAYVEGDDLRKVHWPSTAKRGQILVRQEELLGEPRALVVLDTCAGKHRGEGASSSFEAAVSACASVAMLAIDRRMRLDIVTAEGPLLRTRRPARDDVLEALALLQTSARSDLVGSLGHLDPRRAGGAAVAVVITPGLARSELGMLSRLSAGSPGGAVVLIDASTFDGSRSGRRPETGEHYGLGRPVIGLSAGQSFRAAWEGGVRERAMA